MGKYLRAVKRTVVILTIVMLLAVFIYLPFNVYTSFDAEKEHTVELVKVTDTSEYADYFFTHDELNDEEKEIMNELQHSSDTVHVNASSPPNAFSNTGQVIVEDSDNRLFVFSVDKTTDSEIQTEKYDTVGAFGMITVFMGTIIIYASYDYMISNGWIVFKSGSNIPRLKL